MSALFLVVLAAAPVRLGDLPSLREGERAVELAPRSSERVFGKPRCEVLRRELDDARVKDQWVASCGGEGLWMAVDGPRELVAVGLFSQTSIWDVVALSRKEVASFNEATGPAPGFVPPSLVDALRRRRERLMGTGGKTVVAEDTRDGSRIVFSFEDGFTRVRGEARTPAFPGPRPAPSPKYALWFDVDRAVEAPWLLTATNPWQNVELHLRAPDGADQVLLQLPARESRSSYRVGELETLRVAPRAQPVIATVADDALLVLWPQQADAASSFVARVGNVPSGAWPPPPARACNDARAEHEDVRVFSPRLFEYRGRAYVAFLEERAVTKLRLGAVPRGDELTCDWIADTRRAHTALVLAELTDDGHARELVRADVHAVQGKLLAERTGDVLTTVASSLGYVTVTRFDLAKLAR